MKTYMHLGKSLKNSYRPKFSDFSGEKCHNNHETGAKFCPRSCQIYRKSAIFKHKVTKHQKFPKITCFLRLPAPIIFYEN